MCVSIPSLVLSVDGHLAAVQPMGVRREVSTRMLLDPIAPGDYVTVMAGAYAVEKLDSSVAAESLAYFAEIAESMRP